jgi:hypothetical protein
MLTLSSVLVLARVTYAQQRDPKSYELTRTASLACAVLQNSKELDDKGELMYHMDLAATAADARKCLTLADELICRG